MGLRLEPDDPSFSELVVASRFKFHELGDQRNKLGPSEVLRMMQWRSLAIATAAVLAIPTAALAEGVYVGPGGVRIGPSHRYYNRYEGGGRCAELR